MSELRDPHPSRTRCIIRGAAAALFFLPALSGLFAAEAPPGAGPVQLPTTLGDPPASDRPKNGDETNSTKDQAPVESGPVMTLADCLHAGRLYQSSIHAASASLSSAQLAFKGLQEIRFGQRFIKELPVRKHQSMHGIAGATANLQQVYHDVDASVARMYYAVIYAREQRKVARKIVDRLKATVAVGETLLGQEGAPPDLNALSIERAKLFAALAETRLDEANRGLGRAYAALREAMGLPPLCQFTVADDKLPPVLENVDREHIVRLALACRGEVGLAENGAAIAALEVKAQALAKRTKRPTAAAGGDVHARPVPTGSFGDDYKPGAIGLDFPSLFVGPKEVRVERAEAVAARASAAAEKAKSLVALEAEDAYLRWEETTAKIAKFTKAAKDADALAQRAASALDSGIIQSYRDVLEILVMAAQIQANLNEALYNHAVALTELERVTGGGFPTITCRMP